MTAYYNENDPFAAAWLRELIAENLIAAGDVDERSIVDVKPSDLAGYTQCHFFAGIGVWSYALRNAGWADDTPAWTGSCPCQPFSASGKREGFTDERHLWPEWFRLIDACRPPVIFGEQVAAALGPAIPSASLLALWERENTLRVLKNRIQTNISECLQGLSQYGGEGVAPHSAGLDCSPIEPISGGGKGSVISEGSAIRPNTRIDSVSARSRDVRGNRSSVRHDRTSDVEYTVSGQNQPIVGIYTDQYKSGSVCLECGLRRLGRTKTGSCRLCTLEAASREVECLLSKTRGELEKEDGCSWFDIVQLDLEGAGYAVGAADLCAAGLGAPHIRQRLYFVADAERARVWDSRRAATKPTPARMQRANGQRKWIWPDARTSSEDIDRLALASSQQDLAATAGGFHANAGGNGADGDLGNADKPRLSERGGNGRVQREAMESQAGQAAECRGYTNGFWADAIWLYCRDNKYRPTQPEIFPLAPGTPGRVGLLRGAGNALCAPVAQAFIEAFLELTDFY